MVNAYHGEVSLYDPSGQLKQRITRPYQFGARELVLQALVPYHDRLLAQAHDQERSALFFLDNQLSHMVEAPILPNLRTLYAGWVVNGDDVVGYGSVSTADKRKKRVNGRGFQLGFIRLNLPRASTKLVVPFEDNDYYLVNQQYITTAGGNVYFIAMDTTATIYRLSKDIATRLNRRTVPDEYLTVPALNTPSSGADKVRGQFEELQATRLAVGLYGYDNFIYLLTRNPEALDSMWSLYKIDPRSERLVGRIPLPSLAPHLTLVPGDHYWLAIEKGTVEFAGRQQIRDILSIPTKWITAPEASPLNRPSDFRQCLSNN